MGSYKSVTYTEINVKINVRSLYMSIIDIYRDLTGISYYGFELNQI